MQVALECLSVLQESVAWLSRTIMKGAGQEMPLNARRKSTTPGPQLQGPNHGAHVARACIAATLPSVINCFSRRNLRGPAEKVLAECAVRKVSDTVSPTNLSCYSRIAPEVHDSNEDQEDALPVPMSTSYMSGARPKVSLQLHRMSRNNVKGKRMVEIRVHSDGSLLVSSTKGDHMRNALSPWPYFPTIWCLFGIVSAHNSCQMCLPLSSTTSFTMVWSTTRNRSGCGAR